MNPELIAQVTRLDSDINNLVLNTTVDPARIKELQDRRIALDRKFREFRERMDREAQSFNASVKSEVDSMVKRLQEITKPQ